MEINIGIKAEDRQKISEGLCRLLADSYALYLKTHNYHWNVKGPMFQTLHVMFEEQYTEYAVAVDVIAERIRSLGFAAPGSFGEFLNLTSIADEAGVPAARDMIGNLVQANEAVARTAREVFWRGQKAVRTRATLDYLTQRIQTHEKNAWMLRSLLDE